MKLTDHLALFGGTGHSFITITLGSELWTALPCPISITSLTGPRRIHLDTWMLSSIWSNDLPYWRRPVTCASIKPHEFSAIFINGYTNSKRKRAFWRLRQKGSNHIDKLQNQHFWIKYFWSRGELEFYCCRSSTPVFSRKYFRCRQNVIGTYYRLRVIPDNSCA